MGEWQPIETAPKDEEVLICGMANAGYYCAVAKLVGGIWMQFDPLDDDYSAESDNHSHWMPLPPPPHQSFDGEGSDKDLPTAADVRGILAS